MACSQVEYLFIHNIELRMKHVDRPFDSVKPPSMPSSRRFTSSILVSSLIPTALTRSNKVSSVTFVTLSSLFMVPILSWTTPFDIKQIAEGGPP